MLAIARNELLAHRYRVVRWIGQGAWAVVYEAVDTKLDRSIAIKILNTELVESPELQARFVKEAEAAIHIDSPFVVGVHAVGKLDDGHPYIVMELLDGEDLGRLLQRVGSLKEERAVELAIHALSGLAHAHARGVLHRDIKPDNLVLVRSASGDEVLKIVDLGISKLVSDDKALALTRTNVVMGSPVYMSPEQARGAKYMDHRSDVYSVGVVLFECLTGKLPHDGDNFNDLMFKIALDDAPDPRTKKADIDPRLASIVMKALTRDLDKRFQSASAFREALLEWGAERGAREPPTPSSGRLRLREKKRAHPLSLEVTLDEEEDANADANAASTKPEHNEKEAKEAKATDLTASQPRLVDSIESDDDRARARRKVGIVVALALVVCVGLILIVFATKPSLRSAGANAANAKNVAPAISTSISTTVAEVPTPLPTEPSATASAAKPAASKPPKRGVPGQRNGGGATPRSSVSGRASGSSAPEDPPEEEGVSAAPVAPPTATPNEE